VGQRGHILDRAHGQTGRLERGNGGFATRTRPLNLDIDFLYAKLARLFGGNFGSALGRERGAFAAPLEAHSTTRSKAQRVALLVGDGNDRIVEGRLDMRHSGADIATDLLLALFRHRISPLLGPPRAAMTL